MRGLAYTWRSVHAIADQSRVRSASSVSRSMIPLALNLDTVPIPNGGQHSVVRATPEARVRSTVVV